MSLSSYRVGAVVAVSDMNRAKEFYEGKLGVAGAGEEPAPCATPGSRRGEEPAPCATPGSRHDS